MNINSVSSVALCWAVAKVEIGNDVRDGKPCYWIRPGRPPAVHVVTYNHHENPKGYESYWPTVDWKIGGRLIEKYGIHTEQLENGSWVGCTRIDADGVWHPDDVVSVTGKSALEAAMRCVVARKLGYEIEIPEPLVEYSK